MTWFTSERILELLHNNGSKSIQDDIDKMEDAGLDLIELAEACAEYSDNIVDNSVLINDTPLEKSLAAMLSIGIEAGIKLERERQMESIVYGETT